ncbi:hypothetical protein Lalb_Chr02g0155281 [Lupinus albus]|uniref:Uncharacterized protein n=1 Tax=Lupinus albus TaxID=3870 RepID=A0A6A4R0I8_LUPAL|nr:hypothetical protein Lalb_Chr02g0155281 [Lupinus albus]
MGLALVHKELSSIYTVCAYFQSQYNQGGCSINTYSSKYPCKNADLTSNWKIGQEFCAANAITNLIVSCLATGDKIYV